MSKKKPETPSEPQEPPDMSGNMDSSEPPDGPPDPTELQETAVPPAEIEEPPVIGSLTLSRLDKKRRPNPSTVCEICPASVWLASPKEVKCFCRIMHVISWSTDEPNQLTDCDGLLIASER